LNLQAASETSYLRSNSVASPARAAVNPTLNLIFARRFPISTSRARIISAKNGDALAECPTAKTLPQGEFRL